MHIIIVFCIYLMMAWYQRPSEYFAIHLPPTQARLEQHKQIYMARSSTARDNTPVIWFLIGQKLREQYHVPMRKFTRVFKFAHPIEIKGARLHGIVSRMSEEHSHLRRRFYALHILKNVTW